MSFLFYFYFNTSSYPYLCGAHFLNTFPGMTLFSQLHSPARFLKADSFNIYLMRSRQVTVHFCSKVLQRLYTCFPSLRNVYSLAADHLTCNAFCHFQLCDIFMGVSVFSCNVSHTPMFIAMQVSLCYVQPTHCSLGQEVIGGVVGCPDLGSLVHILTKQC